MIDALIKLILAVLKILVDYKAAHSRSETAREAAQNDIQEMQNALATGDGESVTRLFEQLRTDALVSETRAGAEAGGDNSSGGSGSDTTGQRILQSEPNMDSGKIPNRENAAYAPAGVPSRAETNRIIFHHSASDSGDVEEIDGWHRDRGFACIGYHFVIPRKGHFQYGRKLQLVGAHTQGRNDDSIGVCIIGNLQDYPMTSSQEAECMRLYHDLCRLYSKTLLIEFHHEECPGSHVDRRAFKNVLAEAII